MWNKAIMTFEVQRAVVESNDRSLISAFRSAFGCTGSRKSRNLNRLDSPQKVGSSKFAAATHPHLKIDSLSGELSTVFDTICDAGNILWKPSFMTDGAKCSISADFVPLGGTGVQLSAAFHIEGIRRTWWASRVNRISRFIQRDWPQNFKTNRSIDDGKRRFRLVSLAV